VGPPATATTAASNCCFYVYFLFSGCSCTMYWKNSMTECCISIQVRDPTYFYCLFATIFSISISYQLCLRSSLLNFLLLSSRFCDFHLERRGIHARSRRLPRFVPLSQNSGFVSNGWNHDKLDLSVLLFYFIIFFLYCR
jgi:hypothetical protein